jgi:hypothetical protein
MKSFFKDEGNVPQMELHEKDLKFGSSATAIEPMDHDPDGCNWTWICIQWLCSCCRVFKLKDLALYLNISYVLILTIVPYFRVRMIVLC